jgi:hypothetical protein
MSSTWRAAAETLASDLQRVFGDRLRSIVAYGGRVQGDEQGLVSCLALVSTLTVSDLEACARLARDWRRSHLATPLLLAAEEFQRSLDAFPLEFGEIIGTHARVFGPDPFDGLVVAPADLRRACETQIKSHLLHLREGFIEAGGRPQAIADLVTSSAPAFGALLRHVARLRGGSLAAHADLARAGARAAGVEERLAGEILALEHASAIPLADAARLFPAYLAAVEQLAQAIDVWHD